MSFEQDRIELEAKIAGEKQSREKIVAAGQKLVSEGAPTELDFKDPNITQEQITQWRALRKVALDLAVIDAAIKRDEVFLVQLKSMEKYEKMGAAFSKDPELVKRQKEAEILKKKADLEEKVLTEQDKVIEDGKQKLIDLALKIIAYPPKIPLINPKILQAVGIALQIKKLLEKKNQLSKENLKKGKETYSYPLKPKTLEIPEMPKIPDIPIIPEVPKMPEIPTVTAPTPKPPAVPAPATSGTSASGFGAEQDARDAEARKQFRHNEVVAQQEARVARAKNFLEFQKLRLGNAPDNEELQAVVKHDTEVYNKLVAYLEKVKSDPNIVELTE